MSKRTNYSSITEFLFEVGQLRKILRSHQQEFYASDSSDNISSHSYRVAVIAYILAGLEGVDPIKTLLMALFHDLPETRSGDQNWVHKKYVKVFEEEIINDQFKKLPTSGELLALAKEYGERKTKEAIVAKDADILDQIFLLIEYKWQGNKEAEEWLKHDRHFKMLKTKSAFKIARIVKNSRPNSWISGILTSKRR